MKCRACKHEHSPLVACSVAARLRANQEAKAVNTQPQPVNTLQAAQPSVNTPARKDRHKPGYMKDYMARRRAAQKDASV